LQGCKEREKGEGFMFSKSFFNGWQDVKLYLILILILLLVLSVEHVYFIPAALILAAAVIYYTRRGLKNRQVVYTGYLDNIIRNIERSHYFAVDHLDVGMAVFSKDGVLQWKNELFQKYVGKDSLEGLRPEEMLPLGPSAFETMCVKDDAKVIQIEGRYYLLRYFSVQTQNKQRKTGSTEGKSGLMLFLTDVSELELLKQKQENERVCLLNIRFDNYEDVMKGLSESDRVNLEGAVVENISKWIDEQHGFVCRVTKDSFFAGINYAALRDTMEDKFSILDKVRSIKETNKIEPTLSIGATIDGANLEEVSQTAAKAVEVALGRGGDQAVVVLNGQNQFFGGTSTVTAKSTRVRARIVAHTIHEQMEAADKVFVMGHVNEDYDSIGSCIGIAKMALSLKKQTYIVISGTSVAMQKITDLLNSNELVLPENDEVYTKILVKGDEAVPLVTENSLLMLVDHHRKPLCASKKLLDAIPKKRIIVDHHRRAEDLIPNTVLQYLEPSSSSTSELVTELVHYFDDNLEFSRIEATALYAGLIVDTKNFAVQTGERTFEAAALLRRSGADPNLVRQLFKDNLAAFQERYRIIASAEMPLPGLAIAVNRNIAKDGTHSIIAAQAADGLISINGIVVGVVINEFTDGSLGVSARSDGTINVQIIMEELGGGGHQTVAGVQLQNVKTEDVITQIIALTKKQLDEAAAAKKAEEEKLAAEAEAKAATPKK
jgi:c-di-AMP phosphodiesterase-like protein